MKKALCIILMGLCIAAACQRQKIISPAQETQRSSYTQDIIVTPNNIPPGDYEIVGHVEVAGGRAATIQGLYEKLGTQCRALGGDMVINVRAGQGIKDTTTFDHLPKGYGNDPYRPSYTKTYGWGKGTVIRLKGVEKRKAYFNAKEMGDDKEACAIVGLPYP
jgi:hypothetical protein